MDRLSHVRSTLGHPRAYGPRVAPHQAWEYGWWSERDVVLLDEQVDRFPDELDLSQRRACCRSYG